MHLFSSPRVIATLLGAVISLSVAALAQAHDAQSQEDSSVADAARRNRDKKKSPANPPKSAKVITDDDLDRRNFSPGQEGLNVGASPKLETEPPSAQAVAAAEASDKAEQGSVKEAGEQDAQIARLKEQVKDAEKDLELARRQAALDQDSFLSQADYAHDTAGKANLERDRQQINDKQQEVERLKTRLAALEELKSHRKPARKKAASPPQTENPPSTPPQS
jgi:hypothetical protein